MAPKQKNKIGIRLKLGIGIALFVMAALIAKTGHQSEDTNAQSTGALLPQLDVLFYAAQSQTDVKMSLEAHFTLIH